MIIKIYKNEENRTCLVLLAKRATKKKKKKEEKAVCVFVAVFIYLLGSPATDMHSYSSYRGALRWAEF